MLSIFHKIIRTALIIFPIIILGWLTYKEIAPDGKVSAEYDMKHETPFISKLYPRDRASEAMEDVDGNFYREILSEPFYFDIKPNDSFEKVAITIRYRNSGGKPVKFGGLKNKNLWAFDWRELPSTGGRWQSRTEIFDFSKIIPEGEKYRFGFSAAEMKSGQIFIGEIKILLVKQELDERGVVNKILEGIVWRANKIF